MKEAQLKKKLQELGIPAWGKKDVLTRRHREWVNLWNSNLDASEDGRKTKRELLRKLDEWERTRGGRAKAMEAIVMRKDYDGKSHIGAHKSEFDKLIAAAREKRGPRKINDEKELAAQEEPRDAASHEDRPDSGTSHPNSEPLPQDDSAKPYERNDSALSVIREKVEETNLKGTVQPPCSQDEGSPSHLESQQRTDSTSTGIVNPFVSPSKRLPMFTLPEDPIVDIENSATDP
jgi:E3 ubiquitin-protein ligase RAD18